MSERRGAPPGSPTPEAASASTPGRSGVIPGGVASTPPAPPAAETVFRDRLDIAEHYGAILATTGVSHGLVGPREIPRLWERHLLNCGVVQEVLDPGTALLDVGSGAGLPGVVLAIARPDLRVTLVEPLLRRTTWLTGTIAELGLDNVEVVRARAEDVVGELSAPVVTARAVARLDKLARWCLPLLDAGGSLVALKGASAQEELAENGEDVRALGVTRAEVVEVGDGLVDPPTRLAVLGIDEVVRLDGRGRRMGAGSPRAHARRGARGTRPVSGGL